MRKSMRQAAVINVGSSTLKVALCKERSSEPLSKETLEKKEGKWGESPLDFLKKQLGDGSHLCGVGHRFVHGGEEFIQPTKIDEEVLDKLQLIAPLAPLHNPANIEGVKWMQALFPSLPQIAVFDTAFHHTLPPVNSVYPIPPSWRNMGIRRYGFHGINHKACYDKLKSQNPQASYLDKVVTCHLGNGASLAAILEGKCIDTTMGFTPLEGLVMGTRSGSIDPGIIFYLLKAGKELEEVDHALWYESGLKGLTGTSDMREIEASKGRRNREAELAFDIFCVSVSKGVAAMGVSLGGISALIFTGGIGENSPQAREKIGSCLQFLGVEIDPLKNSLARSGGVISSSSSSSIHAQVIPAAEEVAIAEAVFRFTSHE